MDLREVIEALEATVIEEGDGLDFDVKRVCASDLMSDVLAFVQPGAILLTGLANCHVMRTLEMSETRSVCFVRGKQPSDDAVKLARQKGMTLLATRFSMYESCGRLHRKGLPGCAMER